MTAQPSRRSFGRRNDMPTVTIRHGGGETAFSVRPWMVVTGLGATALFGVVYLGATAYLMFHDELLGAAVRHQMQIESTYEDRIAALRLQIDRLTSKQLLDQDGVEAKVDALMRQQKALQDVGSRLSGLVDKARAQGVAIPETPPQKTSRLSQPETKQVAAAEPVKATSWFAPYAPTRKVGQPISERLALAQASVKEAAQSQAALAESISAMASGEVRRIESGLARLGVAGISTKSARADLKVAAAGGVGGPFIPDVSDPLASLTRAEASLARLEAMRKRIDTLPLRHPLAGELTVTSTFGSRIDPFLGVGAIHTGIDFRAETGTPVIATAPGEVDEAGRQGGYGNMVEIDHGGGIATRYGHLSIISVQPGMKIAAGDVIGYAGSTGRSTGPHLHYETRVNGTAVDPADWLDVGGELKSLLN
jgi:murein DD-endopeptidase MepM/ murein hydrolase activator NlpD